MNNSKQIKMEKQQQFSPIPSSISEHLHDIETVRAKIETIYAKIVLTLHKIAVMEPPCSSFF